MTEKSFKYGARVLNVVWNKDYEKAISGYFRAKYHPLEKKLSLEDELVKAAGREIERAVNEAAKVSSIGNK